jgi:cobalt-precorrin-5B (C1)-methyltransferase
MLNCAAGQDFEAIMVLGHPGKLAKLAMGEWDTHSARSKSALPFVSDLAGDILAGRMQEIPTVDGIFSALSIQERKELGDVLAGRVRMAIGERVGSRMETAVVLVNMQGEIIGSDGDLKRWM